MFMKKSAPKTATSASRFTWCRRLRGRARNAPATLTSSNITGVAGLILATDAMVAELPKKKNLSPREGVFLVPGFLNGW
jgi:hypothetical protein